MSERLDGKVVIVTGGSSGIGRATAIAVAQRGAKVVVAARRIQEGEETVRLAREAGGEALFVQTDVTSSAEVEALIDKTLETYGCLDCAFNNAGVGKSTPLTERTEEDWNSEIDVNLKAVWLCMKYEIPAIANIPLKRLGRAEEVAEAVVWLCSDGASYITGHNLVIDGGYTVQ